MRHTRKPRFASSTNRRGSRTVTLAQPCRYDRSNCNCPMANGAWRTSATLPWRLALSTFPVPGWNAHEKEVMAEHRWWSLTDLRQTSETVWPENLSVVLEAFCANSNGGPQ